MNAPKIQSNGKKIPKNIHPWPFLSVISPSVNATIRYKMAPPIPIPPALFLLKAWSGILALSMTTRPGWRIIRSG